MWIFENDGDFLGGRKLWLRPGKRYLFGRTKAEPGQLAISHATISRKHLTIQVDAVPEGEGRNARSRATVTIEDLGAKLGTLLNGAQIRKQKHTLTKETNEIKMGSCPQLFRITWQPVVLSFSFTSKELRADPWTKLRNDLEQLDIKYIDGYDDALTTHCVSKKRNTSKVLRALINGRYIVTDSFVSAVVKVATTASDEDGADSSQLERDFEGFWPSEAEYLPPRGEEPTQRPTEAYAPDARRKDIFEGYTYIFYEKQQYENLLPVVSSGKGKALFREVVPNQTTVDDFIGYVKGVAGEKGLGEFEDGSEGKGIVLVRFIPTKGADIEWFTNFYNTVALRLDHRPIDQREFLEAILANEPGMLRRPLEVEPTPGEPEAARSQSRRDNEPRPMDVDEPSSGTAPPSAPHQARPDPAVSQTQTRRARKPVKSRFKGFDSDLDDDENVPPQQETARPPAEPEAPSHNTRHSQRKRPGSPLQERIGDVMEDIAPTAAAIKRRRIERGEDPIPREPTPPVEESPVPEPAPAKSQRPQKGRGKKSKEDEDILEMAIQRREEADARARREHENNVPDDDIDFNEIRRLTIVEECEVRQPEGPRSREQDIADGRWDPQWNGRRNFKKFRKQGESAGRQVPRTIVSLEPVKPKQYGISDDYWLEDSSGRQKKKKESQSQAVQSQKGKEKEIVPPTASRGRVVVIGSDSESDAELEDHEDRTGPMRVEDDLPRTRAGKAAEKAVTRQSQRQVQTQAQTQTQSQRTGKRAAAEPPAKELPAKRPRALRGRPVDDSDDSDDELKFRFGKRK